LAGSVVVVVVIVVVVVGVVVVVVDEVVVVVVVVDDEGGTNACTGSGTDATTRVKVIRQRTTKRLPSNLTTIQPPEVSKPER